MIDVCKRNALKYSREVCTIIDKTVSDIFPVYFDFPDHIAVDKDVMAYPYHLNKTVRDVEKIISIFEKEMIGEFYNSWKKNWLNQTLAAAWMHDIGMIEDRDKHGEISARSLFDNGQGYDFDGIDEDDKIKIALICIKHNRDWSFFNDRILNTIVAGSNISINEFKKFFTDFPLKPVWELELSGKLISAADSLRYRGRGLRNNLRQKFSIMSKCIKCGIIYDRPKGICTTMNCKAQLAPTALVSNNIDKNAFFYLNRNNGIRVYRKAKPGMLKEIRGALAMDDSVCVRDKNQVYLRGDLSLSRIRLFGSRVWYNKLSKDGFDNKYIKNKIEGEHGTVLQLTFDNEDINASMFTFSKYIIKHLGRNLVINQDLPINPFSNKVILHIQNPNNLRFVEIYKLFTEKLKSGNEAIIFADASQIVETAFRKWKVTNEIVLPVEIIENRLEVIEL